MVTFHAVEQLQNMFFFFISNTNLFLFIYLLIFFLTLYPFLVTFLGLEFLQNKFLEKIFLDV